MEAFSEYIYFIYQRCKCCCKKKDPKDVLTQMQQLHLKGYQHMEDELNLMGIVKSLFKLKAGLSAIIANDIHLYNKA